eukprot:TRINITY_DN8879_c2_g1_i2.p1 TRINITY_DN8879_c2_g1~~TRINITY_DN8879_c2_g1_i2.p1  ORF type:complete len:985 (+),score=109.83 TRINITY_DN8879_c2_g1_i2:100-3054(+)
MPSPSKVNTLVSRLHGRMSVDTQIVRIFNNPGSDSRLSLQIARFQEMIEKERTDGIYLSFYRNRANWVVSRLKKDDLRVQSAAALLRLCCSTLCADAKSYLEIVNKASEGLVIHSIPPEVLEMGLQLVTLKNDGDKQLLLPTLMQLLTASENSTPTSYSITLTAAIEQKDFHLISAILQMMSRKGILFTNKTTAERLFKLLCTANRHQDAETALGIIHASGYCTPFIMALGQQHRIYGEVMIKNLLKFPTTSSVVDSKEKLPRVSLLNPAVKSDLELTVDFKKYTTRLSQLRRGDKDKSIQVFQEAMSYLQKSKQTGHNVGSHCYLEALMWCKLSDDFVSAVTLYEESRAKNLCNEKIFCLAIACMRTSKNTSIAKNIVQEYRASLVDQKPDIYIYEAALFVCVEDSNYPVAMEIYSWILQDGVMPGPMTYKALIAICCRNNDFERSSLHFSEYRTNLGYSPKLGCVVPPNPHVVFEYTRHIAKISRWGEIADLFEWISETSSRSEQRLTKKTITEHYHQRRRSLEIIISFALDQSLVDPCRRAIVVATDTRIDLGRKVYFDTLSLALIKKDVFFAARLYQFLVPASSAAGLKTELFNIIIKKRINTTAFLQEAFRKIPTQKPGTVAGKDTTNPFFNVSLLCHEICVAFSRLGSVRTDLLAYVFFVQSKIGALNTEKGLYANSHRYRSVVRPILRKQPHLLRDPLFLCTMCSVWNMLHFCKYLTSLSEDKSIKLELKQSVPKPYEVLDIVLSTISSENSELFDQQVAELFTPSVRMFLLRGCFLTMRNRHIRDSDGCRGSYYDSFLKTSILVENTIKKQTNNVPAEEEAPSTLSNLLEGILLGSESELESGMGENEQNHIGCHSLEGFTPVSISRLVLDAAILELQSNSGYFESNLPASKSLMQTVKQIEITFPELSDWVDSFNQSVGSPKAKLPPTLTDVEFLREEVHRLRAELIQEREIADKYRKFCVDEKSDNSEPFTGPF